MNKSTMELNRDMINTIDYNGFKANAWYDEGSGRWSVHMTYELSDLDFVTKADSKVFSNFQSLVDNIMDCSKSLLTEETVLNLENKAVKLYNVYDSRNVLVMTATRKFIQFAFDMSKAQFRSKLALDSYFKSLEGEKFYVAPRESMRLYEIHRNNINGYKREVKSLEIFQPLPPSLSERLITLTPILGELQNEK